MMHSANPDNIPDAAGTQTSGRNWLHTCPLCGGPRRSEAGWELPYGQVAGEERVLLAIRVYCEPGCRWDGLQL
jgi:hypothetical protein